MKSKNIFVLSAIAVTICMLSVTKVSAQQNKDNYDVVTGMRKSNSSSAQKQATNKPAADQKATKASTGKDVKSDKGAAKSTK